MSPFKYNLTLTRNLLRNRIYNYDVALWRRVVIALSVWLPGSWHGRILWKLAPYSLVD
jgi:hypothetical protein